MESRANARGTMGSFLESASGKMAGLPRWAGLGVSASPALWAHLCCGSGCCEQTSFTQPIASMCRVSPLLEAPPPQ